MRNIRLEFQDLPAFLPHGVGYSRDAGSLRSIVRGLMPAQLIHAVAADNNPEPDFNGSMKSKASAIGFPTPNQNQAIQVSPNPATKNAFEETD
jgi:hypothetical protein